MTFIRTCTGFTGLLLLSVAAHAQTINGPESLEYDHRTGITYIANKNADQILMRSGNGTVSLFKQLAVGSPSPHGLRIAGDALYVAFGATVLGFTLNDATALTEIPVAGASFLNGMASDGRSRLWVSDFSTRRIHAIDLTVNPPAVSTLVANTVFTPNGLDYEAAGNRLLVVAWGSAAKIAQVPLTTGAIADLHTTSLSNLDGIARDCAGNLYVSSWGSSALLRFDVPLFSSPPVTVLPSLSQPSDIRFVRHGGAILVPNFGSSTIAVHATDCLYGDGFER
jgi:sugar lactone lactonase YvrE